MAIRNLIPWRGESNELARTTDPFTYLRQQMDQIFEDPFLTRFTRWPSESMLFTPQVDVSESEKEVCVSAELPGLNREDIEVQVMDDAITLSGEKKAEEKTEKEGKRWMERLYGKFERIIPLPAEVQAENAKAEFKNGVLRITLPKAEGSKAHAHKVPIS